MSKSKAPAAEESAPGKKKSKLAVAIVAGVVLLIALIGAKSMLGHKKPAGPPKPVEGKEMALDSFLVNLAGKNDHYLKTTISLGLQKGVDEKKITDHTAAIRDCILTILTSKHRKDISGTAGEEELKSEIKDGINKVLAKPDVVNVYFTEFATQ